MEKYFKYLVVNEEALEKSDLFIWQNDKKLKEYFKNEFEKKHIFLWFLYNLENKMSLYIHRYGDKIEKYEKEKKENIIQIQNKIKSVREKYKMHDAFIWSVITMYAQYKMGQKEAKEVINSIEYEIINDVINNLEIRNKNIAEELKEISEIYVINLMLDNQLEFLNTCEKNVKSSIQKVKDLRVYYVDTLGFHEDFIKEEVLIDGEQGNRKTNLEVILNTVNNICRMNLEESEIPKISMEAIVEFLSRNELNDIFKNAVIKRFYNKTAGEGRKEKIEELIKFIKEKKDQKNDKLYVDKVVWLFELKIKHVIQRLEKQQNDEHTNNYIELLEKCIKNVKYDYKKDQLFYDMVIEDVEKTYLKNIGCYDLEEITKELITILFFNNNEALKNTNYVNLQIDAEKMEELIFGFLYGIREILEYENKESSNIDSKIKIVGELEKISQIAKEYTLEEKENKNSITNTVKKIINERNTIKTSYFEDLCLFFEKLTSIEIISLKEEFDKVQKKEQEKEKRKEEIIKKLASENIVSSENIYEVYKYINAICKRLSEAYNYLTIYDEEAATRDNLFDGLKEKTESKLKIIKKEVHNLKKIEEYKKELFYEYRYKIRPTNVGNQFFVYKNDKDIVIMTYPYYNIRKDGGLDKETQIRKIREFGRGAIIIDSKIANIIKINYGQSVWNMIGRGMYGKGKEGVYCSGNLFTMDRKIKMIDFLYNRGERSLRQKIKDVETKIKKELSNKYALYEEKYKECIDKLEKNTKKVIKLKINELYNIEQEYIELFLKLKQKENSGVKFETEKNREKRAIERIKNDLANKEKEYERIKKILIENLQSDSTNQKLQTFSKELKIILIGDSEYESELKEYGKVYKELVEVKEQKKNKLVMYVIFKRNKFDYRDFNIEHICTVKTEEYNDDDKYYGRIERIDLEHPKFYIEGEELAKDPKDVSSVLYAKDDEELIKIIEECSKDIN